VSAVATIVLTPIKTVTMPTVACRHDQDACDVDTFGSSRRPKIRCAMPRWVAGWTMEACMKKFSALRGLAGFLGTGYAHSNYHANAHAGHGWNGIYDNRTNNSYAATNGFVCSPGGYSRGADGRGHSCR
jgi:hypothetical protein